MLSTGRILMLQTNNSPPAMGITWQKLKVMGTAQKREGGTKAAVCRGVLAPQPERAAQGREGALGTQDGMGEYSLGIAKCVQRQTVDIQSILHCGWLIRVFHSCLLQSTGRFLSPSLTQRHAILFLSLIFP